MTASAQTESMILPRVARGERDAMEECIGTYAGLVWTIVSRYVRDHATAEDLSQECFTAVWKSAHRFDPSIASEKTFIAIIARRRSINHLRAMNSRPTLTPMPESESLPDSMTLAAPDASAPDSKWDGERARQELAKLPPETQQLFDLHFAKGLTHPEIAAQTGIPLGTVKTRLRRGLITLRDRLTGGDSTSSSVPSPTPVSS